MENRKKSRSDKSHLLHSSNTDDEKIPLLDNETTDEIHSDSEAIVQQSNNYKSFLVSPSYKGSEYFNAASGKFKDNDGVGGNNTDDDIDVLRGGKDEFGDNVIYGNRTVRTGRQRKKLAARSKGGEFQTKRSKKRVYFCCVSSDIDVQKLFDYLVGASGLLHGWKFQLHDEVLHLYKPGYDEVNYINQNKKYKSNNVMINQNDFFPRTYQTEPTQIYCQSVDSHAMNYNGTIHSTIHLVDNVIDQQSLVPVSNAETFRISNAGAQEVFVFDFGAVVFWGFQLGEETNLLKTIRMFVTKGFVGVQEFQYGEDDMAFVTSNETKKITIANDVITLPENCLSKQRLSVSFAIAQSSVLAIFEARIDKKIEEYKFIPETLAAYGSVHLSERQLGMMIGEVFVIRHDVNLHTEILDIPDFFWKEEKLYEEDYKMVMSYLEMSQRTEILNKRLDMLRDLLDVLQQQMENAHAVKLEWIVIYLIVVECVIQALAMINK